MRIVGGRLKGRPLAGPGKSEAIRPTSDRLREAIFNILAHGYEDVLSDARVLDLFAGTGALGLEALSRGAASALFVELSAEGGKIVARNIEALGLVASARLLRQDATRLGRSHAGPSCNLIFCDPPYGRGLAAPALRRAAQGGWLADGALALIEERTGSSPALPDVFERLDVRVWGETEVTFARFLGSAGPVTDP